MADDGLSIDRASGFGERLRAVRLQLGLSQAQLAERAGLSARTIRRLEQSADPSGYPATRDLLAGALDLPDATAAWLFGTRALPLLPAPDLPLLGRDGELAAAVTLLSSPAIKVVSIIGPGGVGKSRLALEVANEIAAGHRNVAVVRLGAVSHAADALPAIAAALRIQLPFPGQDVLPALAHALGRAPSLLVLDNLEHLVGIAPELATLVRITLDLKLLLTSREALRISGERLIPLAPLDTRGPDSPGVRLFLQHVERARPDFRPGDGDLAEIQTICERMSGLPLAIELAAAQAETRSLQRVRAMLDQTGLASLSGGTGSLHTSMASAIEWSWNLLDPADQHALALLSVFPSGFDVQGLAVLLADGAMPPDGAQEADAARALGALLRKHLVARLPAEPFDREPRYVLLEPISLFARERLRAAGGESRCRTIHAEYTAARFEGMDDLIQLNQVAEMERIEQAYPDGRAALDWALDTDDVALASRLVSALKYAHVFRYRTPGVATQLARLLPRFAALTPHARLWTNYERAELASREGDLPQLQAVLADIIAIARAADDPVLEAMALLYRSCDLDEDPRDALATVDRARALLGADLDATSPPFLQAWALVRRGIELHRLGRLDEALAELEAGIARKRAEGNEAGSGPPLAHLGRLLQELGRPRDAARALIAALDIAASLRDDWLAFHAACWLAALARTGDHEARVIAARLDAALAAVQAEQQYALHPGEPPLTPPGEPAAGPERALPLAAAIALARALPDHLPERADAPPGARFTGGRLE